MIRIFDTKDLKIDNEELKECEFFIEIDEQGLSRHIEYGVPLDLVWRIGYYYNGKNYHKYWVDILKDLVDRSEFTEEEEDEFLELQRVFEDRCVKISKKVEEEFKKNIRR